jgi:nitrate/nitrite transporter NarK
MNRPVSVLLPSHADKQPLRSRRRWLAKLDWNLGGFAGPYSVGWIRQSTNSFTAGLDFLAAAGIAAGVVGIDARARETQRTTRHTIQHVP